MLVYQGKYYQPLYVNWSDESDALSPKKHKKGTRESHASPCSMDFPLIVCKELDTQSSNPLKRHVRNLHSKPVSQYIYSLFQSMTHQPTQPTHGSGPNEAGSLTPHLLVKKQKHQVTMDLTDGS